MWAKKGRKVCLNVPPKGTNLSLIAAVGKDKIYGFQIFQGSLTAKDFGAFLVNVIDNDPHIKTNLFSFVRMLQYTKLGY